MLLDSTMMRAIALLIPLLLGGCAASLRAEHRSAIYFERCFAADVDPARNNEERERCWAAWEEHYSQGQPPHRQRHARDRRYALSRGESLPPLPGAQPSPTEPAEGNSQGLAGEDPARNAHQASEPPTPGSPAGAERRASARPPRPPRSGRGAPHSPCHRACVSPWEGCVQGCAPEDDPCVSACENEHRACVGACY